MTHGKARHLTLREAVWMMLFRGEAEEVQLRLEPYPLPAGLIPRLTVLEERGDDVSFSGMITTTAQTSLTWRWLPPTGDAFVGQLTWPSSYEAAEDHAASLLAIAEEGLVEGCVEHRVPPPSTFNGTNARRLNDVDTDSIKELDGDFRDAFDAWKMLPVCGAAVR